MFLLFYYHFINYFLKNELSIEKPFNYNVWSKKKTSNDVFFKKCLVGTAGFEPTAPYYTLFEWANITKSIKAIKYSSLDKLFH